MYYIVNKNRPVGIADFVDEAQRCAERMSRRSDVAWTPAGVMVDFRGEATDWKLMRAVRR